MLQRLLPLFMREGRDGKQPAQPNKVSRRLSPTSVLPHMWGRKRLPHVSSEAACGSVSFPYLCGKVGMENSQHNSIKSGVVCPPPLSSPTCGGGRCCHMWGRKRLPHASSEAACCSVSFPHSWGKAGMGDNAQRTTASYSKWCGYSAR